MRRSRLQRSRERRRIKSFRILFQLPLTATISIFIFITPTFALLEGKAEGQKVSLSSSFIFPETLDDMVLKVKSKIILALDLLRNEQTLMAKLATVQKQEKPSLIRQIMDLASKIEQLLEQAITICNELGHLSDRAQLEGDPVYSYVQSAYQEANSTILYLQSRVPAFTGDSKDLLPPSEPSPPSESSSEPEPTPQPAATSTDTAPASQEPVMSDPNFNNSQSEVTQP